MRICYKLATAFDLPSLEAKGSSGSDFAGMGKTDFTWYSGSRFAGSKWVAMDMASPVAEILHLH